MTTIQTSTDYWTSTAIAVAAMNTLASSTAIATVQSKKKPTWKWSGEDTPLEHRRWDDDEDDVTYTREENEYSRWYDTHQNWRDDDVEDESDKHKFGLCCTCKKGLDDRADFVCNTHTRPSGGFYMLCFSCYEEFNKPWYLEERY